MSKDLHLKLILPLTILTFGLVTKWHYAQIGDWTDEFFMGFPLIHKGPAMHTSIASKYFLFELTVNLVLHYAIIAGIVILINQFIAKINIPKTPVRILWTLTAIYLTGHFYLSYVFDDTYKLKRDFEIELLDHGVILFFQMPPDRALLQSKEEKPIALKSKEF